MGTQAVYPYR